MKTSDIIDMWDRKVMYGYSTYDEGVILFRFEDHDGVFYTEQKIHIDNKMLGFFKDILKND